MFQVLGGVVKLTHTMENILFYIHFLKVLEEDVVAAIGLYEETLQTRLGEHTTGKAEFNLVSSQQLDLLLNHYSLLFREQVALQ